MRQFHELSPTELAALDIAEVNLECATDLPGSENLDVPAALSKLDEWAEAIRLATARHWPRFERHPLHLVSRAFEPRTASVDLE